MTIAEDHGYCPRADASVYTSAHSLSARAGVHEGRRQSVHVVIARGQSPARGGRLHDDDVFYLLRMRSRVPARAGVHEAVA